MAGGEYGSRDRDALSPKKTQDLALWLNRVASTSAHHYLVEGVGSICFGFIALGLTSSWTSQYLCASRISFLKELS